VPALDKAGIVDTLVDTLSHESSHCVAAAAGNLYVLDRLPGGQEAVGATDAIPALVCILKRAHTPSDHENDTFMSQRYEQMHIYLCMHVRLSMSLCMFRYHSDVHYTTSGCLCESLLILADVAHLELLQ
jgi:hypothetical protein